MADWFAAQDGPVGQLAYVVRDGINTRWSFLSLKPAWNFPCWSGNERIFSIIPHTSRLNVQLWSGNRLAPDYPNRIEGTGKALRHVKLRSDSDLDEEFWDILSAAIALDSTAPEKVR